MGLEERTRPHAGSPPERPHARADWRQMLAIGVIASILGIAAGILIDWFPLQASTQAKPIDTLWDVLIICSVPVFCGVMVVVLFSVWKFRMRPGEEELDGPPIHGNTKLEVVWTAVPAIMLVALCTYAFLVLEDVEKTPAGQVLNVRVVGEQFEWSFYYQDPSNPGKEVVAHELHLPVNQPVKFTIQSKDVLHDFWVPAFRIKKDAVPGIDVTYRVTPNRIGTYQIVCAELCGLGHATMRGTTVVSDKGSYDKWLAGLGKPAATATASGTAAAGGAAPDGKAEFAAQGCGACHTLSDAGATGTVGPDLDKALVGKTPDFIKQSIVDPGAVVENGYTNIMPPGFGDKLGDAGVDALVTYLSDVTKGG